MRRYIGVVLMNLAVILFMTAISSCKDDEPPAKAKLSFAESSITYNEADDIIEIQVKLDKPATEDFTAEYELNGTAQDEETATQNSPADYMIIEDLSDYGEIDIDKGETVGIIQIQLYTDFELEDDETIEISLIDVDSDKVELTRDDETEITLQQEDGLIIRLSWPSATVDMDLLVRIGATTSTWEGILTGSVNGFPEIAFIPEVIGDAAYGMSYTYYDGIADPLDFTVAFIELDNGEIEPQANWLSFTGRYTLANINKWDDISTTQVVQTFERIGTSWTNFSSPITIPASGSRVITNIPSEPVQVKTIKRSPVLKHK